MFSVLEMAASGMQAQRVRMTVVAQNILNADSTGNAADEPVPYKPRKVVLRHVEAANGRPAKVEASVHLTNTPPIPRNEPGHRHANANGDVMYPSVDVGAEYVNAMEASRAYEANVTLMEVTKAMLNASLRLLA